VGEAPEYAILTAEISKAAFGVTPTEYKVFKGLKRENLRDHMTDLELIFSMLGEAATHRDRPQAGYARFYRKQGGCPQGGADRRRSSGKAGS